MANMMVAFLPRLLEVAWPDEIPFVEGKTPQEEEKRFSNEGKVAADGHHADLVNAHISL